MKILVVDDEKDVQALFEQRFRKEIRSKEMEFHFAFSGDEALTYLNGNMMITAYGDQENYDTAMRLGADAFLSKPVDFPLLKEKLLVYN